MNADEIEQGDCAMNDSEQPVFAKADMQTAIDAMREATEGLRLAKAEIARLRRSCRWRSFAAGVGGIIGAIVGQALAHLAHLL